MRRRPFLINVLDLLVLCCLAIAQPIFDLLGKNVEFLAARNSDAIDVLLLAIVATFLVPVLLSIVEFLAGLIGARTCGYVHRILIWILVALLLLPPMKPFYRTVGNWWIVIALAIAGILSETYVRLRTRGLVLGYLSPIVLILPGLFLFYSPVYEIVFSGHQQATEYPKVKATAPIVMVVFDEFPLTSLMDDHQEINSLRYPNIAKFARRATWYRNASSVAASTLHSVPAILDGQFPDPDRQLLPYAKDHPHSLFTLLGGSYRLNVVENNTRLCPEDLCGPPADGSSRFQSLTSICPDIGVLYLYILIPADLTRSLPDITQSWKEFTVARTKTRTQTPKSDDFDQMTSWDERPHVFARFVESIRPDSRPTLNFLHILLPHAPWEYLPSGKKHTLPENGIRGLVGVNDRRIDSQQWLDDPWAIQQAYKKHLLQVGMVDRLIGNLINHLEEVNLFEPSLIVITADHGTSFQANASRRVPSMSNYPDIMAIPLFIKAPNQNRGVIDDSNIETIDILPTMADILGIQLPWTMEGKSVLNRSIPAKTQKTIVLEDGKRIVVDGDLSAIRKSVREKLAIFGYKPEDLFHIGPYKELIGQNIQSLNVTRSSVKCTLDERAYLDNVDLKSQFVPANIKGRLMQNKKPPALPLNVAISVNDKIQGVSQAYSDPDGSVRFSLVLPENSFQQGYNRVRIYLIFRVGNRLELAQTDSDIRPYHWGDTLSFGADGNAGLYETGGWSGAEEKITWTGGTRAELVLPTSTPQSAISLRLYAGVYLHPDILNSQRVRLYVNGQAVADWTLTSKEFTVRDVAIPQSIFRDSKRTVITIETPDAIAPSAIGDGVDRRTLGLAMAWLSLTENRR